MNRFKFLLNWDKHSSVRSSPRRLVPVINESHLFSSNLAPILAHSLVTALPGETARKIEAQFLYYYLQFTEFLETCLVNKVILSIINDEFPIKFDEAIKNEAFKIYCDEAYHAQQARDTICQVKNVSNKEPLNLPIALKNRLTFLSDSFPTHMLPYFDLLFVCVAETLVSQELREHMKDKSIHPGIQDIMRDHAKDEASHALFFKEVMICLKRYFSIEDYKFFLNIIPAFLEAYLRPEKGNLQLIFESYIDAASIETIISDSMDAGTMGTLIFNSSKTLRRFIMEIEKEETGSL